MESLDIDTLTSRAKERDAEVKKAQDAELHFKKASDLFLAAGGGCTQYKNQMKFPPESSRLVDEDIRTFEQLSKGTADLAQQLNGRTLPSQDAVQAVNSKISEMMTWAAYRAKAHKGTPGHLPDSTVKF